MVSRNATVEDFEAVLKVLKKGSIDVERFITHRAPFNKFETWLKPEASNWRHSASCELGCLWRFGGTNLQIWNLTEGGGLSLDVKAFAIENLDGGMLTI